MFSGCAAPNGGGPGASLPAAAQVWLAPDSLRTAVVAEGVHYHFAWSPRGPWAVHLAVADLARCDLDLLVVAALEEGGEGLARTRQTVREMAPGGSHAPLVGVNGDFLTPEGSPLGPEATSRTRRTSSRPALSWDSLRRPSIGPDTVAAGVAAPVEGLQIIGGYPELIDVGERVEGGAVEASPSFAAARHPRTGVGYDQGAGLLWMAVVDGRQGDRSAGMTLTELAGLFEALGATEALNLDGGGSSTMVIGSRLANTPSDVTGERAVANSLWLVRDPSGCRPPHHPSQGLPHPTDSPR